jgi:pSer/pThr/pTyr-binding forkhead associated (FHA) protein
MLDPQRGQRSMGPIVTSPAERYRRRMEESPAGLHQSTPAEVGERLAAERRGSPFLVLRDEQGAQLVIELAGRRDRMSLGRSTECNVALPWDGEVSRLHAELERVGSQWLIVDDGLSSNGTFVAGERVVARRRLRDGDVLRLGTTSLLFRDPAASTVMTTRLSDQRDIAVRVTDQQRRVLVALCRPYKHQPAAATPATNPQIAAELYLTVAAVKAHLRSLFHAFEIDDLPQQEKRRKLVALAFAAGLISDRDL